MATCSAGIGTMSALIEQADGGDEAAAAAVAYARAFFIENMLSQSCSGCNDPNCGGGEIVHISVEDDSQDAVVLDGRVPSIIGMFRDVLKPCDTHPGQMCMRLKRSTMSAVRSNNPCNNYDDVEEELGGGAAGGAGAASEDSAAFAFGGASGAPTFNAGAAGPGPGRRKGQGGRQRGRRKR